MRTVGIITEYNPFHNGHLYHLQKAKEITNSDYVICVMSGNFLQRGTPAIMDKYARTKLAIENGIDLLLELPVCYSTASAEYFAYAGVYLLNSLGIVDTICFGSEIGNIQPLMKIAEIFMTEPPMYKSHLLELLKQGIVYPKAREKSCLHYLKLIGDMEYNYEQILPSPNNILGIEYIKALLKLKSDMIPITLQRTASGYHDTILEEKEYISSATAIRNSIDEQLHVLHLNNQVPNNVYTYMVENYHKTFPINSSDFSNILNYKILLENIETFSDFLDITPELANRIFNLCENNMAYMEFANELKTKNITLTRCLRSLCHIMLNIKKSDFESFEHPRYIRILGLKKETSSFIKEIKKKASLPVIQKLSTDILQLDDIALRMFQQDMFAHKLFSSIQHNKFNMPIINEYQINSLCV